MLLFKLNCFVFNVYFLSVYAFNGNQSDDLGALLFEFQNTVWNKAQTDNVGAIGLFQLEN